MIANDALLVAQLRAVGTKECLDTAIYVERASTPEGAQALFDDVLDDARAQGDDPFILYPRSKTAADEMLAVIRVAALEIVSTN